MANENSDLFLQKCNYVNILFPLSCARCVKIKSEWNNTPPLIYILLAFK